MVLHHATLIKYLPICRFHPSAGLKMGICGEHGGDPASIALCEEVELDYVSRSPYRVLVARLAAAQAALGVGGIGQLENEED